MKAKYYTKKFQQCWCFS